jgi:hypothetical protein
MALRTLLLQLRLLPRMIWNSREKCTQHELGRGSIFTLLYLYVTKEMIVAGDDTA